LEVRLPAWRWRQIYELDMKRKPLVWKDLSVHEKFIDLLVFNGHGHDHFFDAGSRTLRDVHEAQEEHGRNLWEFKMIYRNNVESFQGKEKQKILLLKYKNIKTIFLSRPCI
jgi:hypothetical protein